MTAYAVKLIVHTADADTVADTPGTPAATGPLRPHLVGNLVSQDDLLQSLRNDWFFITGRNCS